MTVTEHEFYGVPPLDSNRYFHVFHGHPSTGHLCVVCLRHPSRFPYRACDLELARAAEMDDPRFCQMCRRAFDRMSCNPVQDTGTRDVCGDCQGRFRVKRVGRQFGLSSARMRFAARSNPHVDFSRLNREQVWALAHEEVIDA